MRAGPVAVREPDVDPRTSRPVEGGRDPRAEQDADDFAAGYLRTLSGSRVDDAAPPAGPRLDLAQQAQLEALAGFDLDEVRIHNDAEAAGAAEQRRARAFTIGSDIYFGAGAYRPGTPAGDELIAHEVAHAVSQGEGGVVSEQHDPEDGPATGLGSSPPAERFITMEEGPGVEDTFLLFEHDRVDFAPADLAEFRRLLQQRTGPVEIHVHAYASNEGQPDYNLNLSAHRGTRIKAAIEPLLPPESRVTVFAYGSTHEFGEPDDNRRVGIDIEDRPSQFDLDVGRLMQRGSFNLDLDLRLDRPPPLGAGVSPDLDPDVTPVVVPPPILDPRVILRPRYGPLREFNPAWTRALPADEAESHIDWRIGGEFTLRGTQMTEGDRLALIQHVRIYYPLAEAVWGIGGPVRWFFDDPDDIMDSMLRKTIQSGLTNDHPTPGEILDRSLEEQGLPTPIYTPTIDLFELGRAIF